MKKNILCISLLFTCLIAKSEDINYLGNDFLKNKGIDVPLSNVPEGVKQLDNLQINKNVARAALSKISEGSNAVRGAKEQSIFQKVSSGTVIVVSKDGIGSGVLLTKSGYVLTNLHVVGDQKVVDILFSPKVTGQKPSIEDGIKGRVQKINQTSDLALIKVDAIPSNAKIVLLSDDEVKVGQDVHAVGHPNNQLWTYTRGYVSQVRADYQWKVKDTPTPHKADVVQTQTPINPGNSGGPLVNDRGELIGINTFISPENPGLNYAVHVTEIKRFLSQKGDLLAPVITNNKSKCGKDPVYENERESKELGKYFAFGMDANCDGEVESEFIITLDKSKPNLFVLLTEDKKSIQMVVYDQDKDGKWEISLYDTDGDGKFDTKGFHENGKLEATRYEKM